MRALYKYFVFLGILLLGSAVVIPSRAQEADFDLDNNGIIITGTVRDRETRRRMENVTVTLVGTSIGTVTNADGVFSLKISGSLTSRNLEFSHIGYQNTSMLIPATSEITAFSSDSNPNSTSSTNQTNTQIFSSKHTVTIWMTPTARQLDEALIFGADARQLVEEALRNIPDNYPRTNNQLQSFYRETVQKGQRYISVSEAMMDVYKTPYLRRDPDRDRVRLTKARRLMSPKASDTLAVKVEGGPTQSLYLDIVKNPDILFNLQTLDYYSFILEPYEMMDGRIQYVIRFEPRAIVDYALCEGRIYIDREELAITRAEYFLDVSDTDKATSAILRKKPFGIRFRPLEVHQVVQYKLQGDVAYLSYIRNEIRFKCDWKRRLFSSVYTARSEMVVVERDEQPQNPISRQEAFKSSQIFYDMVNVYWDEDFWKDYNIIEPTESLENAVKKLRR
ncbi:MAG: carboxypeptidase-like regulatory domain-containing protein [Bacteroidales bacterium]|nr:carboxypeptidase-like regulatory domain-containing protein [Bacteroidales bacterium]